MTRWTALAFGLASLAGLIAWLARHDYRDVRTKAQDAGAI